MSRIENNKFQINKDYFSIRDAVEEVCKIMEFQVLQKNLALNVDFESSVPDKLFSDQKRYR